MPEIDASETTIPLVHFFTPSAELGHGFTAKLLRFVPSYKKIFVNHNTTVVLWDDDTRTKATCAPEDLFDPKIGFAICLMKKLYPKRQRERILKRVEVQHARDDAR